MKIHFEKIAAYNDEGEIHCKFCAKQELSDIFAYNIISLKDLDEMDEKGYSLFCDVCGVRISTKS